MALDAAVTWGLPNTLGMIDGARGFAGSLVTIQAAGAEIGGLAFPNWLEVRVVATNAPKLPLIICVLKAQAEAHFLEVADGLGDPAISLLHKDVKELLIGEPRPKVHCSSVGAQHPRLTLKMALLAYGIPEPPGELGGVDNGGVEG
jgi:hypothetical protein